LAQVMPHVPAEHVAEPLLGTGQAFPHAPQLAGSDCKFVHRPVQTVFGAEQTRVSQTMSACIVEHATTPPSGSVAVAPADSVTGPAFVHVKVAPDGVTLLTVPFPPAFPGVTVYTTGAPGGSVETAIALVEPTSVADGLTDKDAMAGQTMVPASMSTDTEPVPASANTTPPSARMHKSPTLTCVVAPVVMANAAGVLAHMSPAVSVAFSVMAYPPPAASPPTMNSALP
jgi:hypothetical protein